MSLSPSVSRSGSAFHTFKANDVKMETDGEDLLPGVVGMKRKRSSTSASNSDRRRASTSTSTPGVGVGAVGLAQVPSQASIVSEAVSATSISTPVEGPVKVEGEGDATQGGETIKKEEVVVSVKPELYAEEARRRGRAKGRTEEEVEAMAGVAYRFATSLASDHHHVLNPDTETPFSDAHDVVKRLLPYHGIVLLGLMGRGREGDGGGVGEEEIRDEVALDCWRRKTDLEKRFRKARIAEGKVRFTFLCLLA
ncbi:hypothetical protein BC629DRAFT_1554373 [Irpex lacteus]|nr:hypothetical protein BC629DRAFT_1554373 [Irpex lacteus]